MRRFIESLNFKFLYLKKSFGKRSFKLLDIGSGNHSATKTCRVFPNCQYYGLDISKNYNNDENDFRLMKDFYELDLNKLNFSSVPENYFDAIMMNHVIEHLQKGDEVIKVLLSKLRGGVLYILNTPDIEAPNFLPCMVLLIFMMMKPM
ncbi:MAG: class I SAM-dependent methyltransferase [Sphingobacteriales bacterium]|nr:class I SAM-dependent methyltransferase [Sphingobacteriales bacterium]